MSPQKKENYFQSFKKALIKPQKYVDEVASYTDLKQGFVLFLINLCLGFLMFVLLRAVLERNTYIVFSSMSETLFALPFFVALFFLVFFLLHIFAKILGGKNSFKNLLNTCLSTSFPIVFIGVPLVQIFNLIWILVLLVFIFSKIYGYSKSKASFNILLPFLVILLLLIMTGLINLNLLKFGL